MQRHFTATAYILKESRFLLIFHKKLRKWLPPGGHLDPNETPAEGARREVLEETGLEIEIILQENIWVERANAKSFERPYLCLIEEIPPFGDQEAHQHLDFIYVAKVVGGKENHNATEVDGMHWFSLDEIDKLSDDEDIFKETKETIHSIYQNVGCQ